MSEAWKPVPGYGSHYEASSLGNVRVLDRSVVKRTRHGGVMSQAYKGRLLKRVKDGGYAVVSIGWDGCRRKVKAAVLVLSAFNRPPVGGEESCHKNGQSLDDRIENLYWGSHLENMADRKRHGRYASGTDHPMAKFSDEQIRSVRSGAVSLKDARSKIGMSRTHYYRIRYGKLTIETLAKG